MKEADFAQIHLNAQFQCHMSEHISWYIVHITGMIKGVFGLMYTLTEAELI